MKVKYPMKKLLRIIFSILLLFSFIFAFPAQADINSDIQKQQNRLKENEAEQARLRQALKEAQNQERTLANQISYLENQALLTELEIAQKQAEIQQKQSDIEETTDLIENVGDKILRTKQSINSLTDALHARIRSSYITSQSMSGPNLPVLIGGVSNIQDLVARYKYFKVVELHDRKILDQLEETKIAFTKQKEDLEIKKKDLETLKEQLSQDAIHLESQKLLLAEQKSSKDYLLRITQNDEAHYQATLNQIMAEQQSLQNAFNQLLAQIKNPGNGVEVRRGEVIGIQGNSGNATGDHLHFGLYSYTVNDFINGNVSLCSRHLDAAPYLNSGEFYWPVDSQLKNIPTLADFNASDDYYCSQGVCQVYGQTNFAQAYASMYCPYGFHNGIDMNGPAGAPIYAVADGIAYTIRLGQAEGNGVFMFHPNGLMTLFWHMR